MPVAVITPTGDRPECIALLERWMSRQTRQPDLWVVSDNGDTPATLTMGQKHVRAPFMASRNGIASNSVNAVSHVPEDHHIVVMEDDDWYPPDYIEKRVAVLEKGADLSGSIRGRTYNVRIRHWTEITTKGESWSIWGQTAIRAGLKPYVERTLRHVLALGKTPCRHIWEGRGKVPEDAVHHVGIKGMPGRAGVTKAHRVSAEWAGHWGPTRFDSDLSKLREWVGEDAAAYEEFFDATL